MTADNVPLAQISTSCRVETGDGAWNGVDQCLLVDNWVFCLGGGFIFKGKMFTKDVNEVKTNSDVTCD